MSIAYLFIPLPFIILYFLIKWIKRERINKRRNNALQQTAARRPLNIVVTGAGRGIGFYIAKCFLNRGDNVIICTRSESSVKAAVEKLQQEATEKQALRETSIAGCAADISKWEDVQKLVQFAKEQFSQNEGAIDIWVNNAGIDGGKGFLVGETSPEGIRSCVDTNLTGLMYCCKAAAEQMHQQQHGGHIFNMEGRGSNGMLSQRMIAYGATKYALVQVTKSLSAELTEQKSRVGVHRIQPGMCITDLLIEGTTPKVRKFFNIAAEDPEIVAEWLVSKMRSTSGTDRYYPYLTVAEFLWRFLTAFKRRNRFFDADGKYVYPKQLLSNPPK